MGLRDPPQNGAGAEREPPQNGGDGGEGPLLKTAVRVSPQKWGGVFLKYGEENPTKWLQGSERPLPKMGVMAVRDAPKMAPEECWACPQNA